MDEALRVRSLGEARGGVRPDVSRPVTLASLYDRYFDQVLRWLRACGCPRSDLEDVAQDVFLTAGRKLGSFREGNVAGWLFRISAQATRSHRRRAWLRQVFLGPVDEERPAPGPLPDGLVAQAQTRATVERILADMSEKRRVVLVLFDLEGYSGEEIAALLEVPVATVWTRLHHARKDFRERAKGLFEEGGCHEP